MLKKQALVSQGTHMFLSELGWRKPAFVRTVLQSGCNYRVKSLGTQKFHIPQKTNRITVPSLKLTVCTVKMMVGMRSFPFGMAHFQVRTVSFSWLYFTFFHHVLGWKKWKPPPKHSFLKRNAQKIWNSLHFLLYVYSNVFHKVIDSICYSFSLKNMKHAHSATARTFCKFLQINKKYISVRQSLLDLLALANGFSNFCSNRVA